ncbi:alpha-tubulin suppressor-like RCC1 family protein [Nocardioides cavernae]|uniref:Alpha-tubulin suppressor-like RCC1 family protein n=1 Tax=Nocardioides cavernae TaxID=1921566 RepID=A0A7Y9H583_9ACTN|nr:alpha-tubulin suppressor-like RCC1 family protein [Nocardioides cavernae]
MNLAGSTTPPSVLATKTATSVAAGQAHSLALTSDGEVVGWGDNQAGQATPPAALAGTTVTAIAAGGQHSLALSSDGQVIGWGSNSFGQAAADPALNDKHVTAIAAGFAHSLALTSDGRVTAWGFGDQGQTNVPSSLDGKTVTAIAAGANHSVALTSDGKVTAWGNNGNGQITAPPSLADETVIAIAAGTYHTLALTSAGELVTWGYGGAGLAPVPSKLDGLRVSALAAGGTHSLAITAALRADHAPVISGVPQVSNALTAVPGTYTADPDSVDFVWKANGTPVGTSAATYRPTPADLGKTLTVTVTAEKSGYADAVTTSAATGTVTAGGRVTAWGSNFQGESTVPASLARKTVTAIAAGFNHTLALTADGKITAWGAGTQGTVPSAVAAQTVAAIAAGTNHNLALTTDGRVLAWGNSGNARTAVPATLDGRTVIAVAAGDAHSLALTDDGQLTAWGSNSAGQAAIPDVLNGKLVVAVAAGSNHSLALTSDGQVVAWGSNTQGQSTVPATLSGRTVVAIGGGTTHSIALTADGKVTAWGGDNTSNQAVVPASLATKTVVAVATGAGSDHTLAMTSDRQIVGWGTNANGARTIPTSLNGRPNTAIAAGGTHSLALTAAVIADQAPSISGTPAVGSTLSAEIGDYNVNPDTYGLQWLADGVEIPGAIHLDFTPTVAQLGRTITLSVTVTRNGHADAVDATLGVGPVTSGSFTTGPDAEITGTPVVDGTLTASPGAAQLGSTSPAAESFTYSWAADGTTISGATGRTLDLTPAMVGQTITVTVTAARDGYADATDTSAATVAVAKAAFTTGPEAQITGTPVVDGTLTASPGAAQLGSTSPPAESFTYAWAADGTTISGATGRTLDLTPAMVGTTITVTVTSARDGYADATDTSAATAAVAKAAFTTGPDAQVTGTPVVDGVLKAVVSAPTPAADSYTYAWFADGSQIGGAAGEELALPAELVGKRITVEVSASREGYVDATAASEMSAAVVRATFATAPPAAVSGTAQVGHVLTALTGPTAPAATAYRFEWLADDMSIPGADSATLLLTSAHRGQRISVRVIATRAGYTDASTRSSSTGPVATDQAPSVQLTISVPAGAREAAATPDGQPTIRRGRTATVSWTSHGGASLSATGALQDLLREAYGASPVPANGSAKVTLDRTGLHTFRMIASNELGSTSASTSVVAVRAPTRLTVGTVARATRGTTIRLRVTGLGFGERYVITVNGERVGRTGTRADASTLVRRITLPRTLEPGKVRITVTGRSTRRTGTATVNVS